jgi:hypothetical protein
VENLSDSASAGPSGHADWRNAKWRSGNKKGSENKVFLGFEGPCVE